MFTDGSVALRWRGNNPATAVWPDVESVLAVHGHQGATEVRWLEDELEATAGSTAWTATDTDPWTVTDPDGWAGPADVWADQPAWTEPERAAGFELSERSAGFELSERSAGFDAADAAAWADVAGEPAEAGGFDLEELLGGQHTVLPPSSIADPSALPPSRARGWAGARHLR